MEHARQSAASAYKQSVDQQLPALGELAAAISLNMVQTHPHPKASTSSCTLPSESDYVDDFEGDKTGSSKQSTAASTGRKTTASLQDISEVSSAALSHEARKSETSTSEPTVFEKLNSTKSSSTRSVNTAKSLREKSKLTGEYISKSASHTGTIVEELTIQDSDTPNTTKTNMETNQDGDNSEVLFEQKTLLGNICLTS